MDLATRIRMELADGKSPDQVVEELTAAGMTEPTARRHVERARMPEMQLSAPQATSDSNGKWAMTQGALLMSALVTMMVLSVMVGAGSDAISKRRYLLGIAGVVFFVRGYKKWSQSGQDEFPTTLVLIGAVTPVVIAVGFLAWRQLPHRTIEAAQQATPAPAATELTSWDLSKYARSKDPEKRCQAATEIGKREAMTLTSELSIMLMWDFDGDVKQCARDAFARLLQSQDELKRLTTIHTLGHEAGGKLFDDLLRSAAEHDPSEPNRNTARAMLERRLQARQR
jgi:hypothetical protein